MAFFVPPAPSCCLAPLLQPEHDEVTARINAAQKEHRATVTRSFIEEAQTAVEVKAQGHALRDQVKKLPGGPGSDGIETAAAAADFLRKL